MSDLLVEIVLPTGESQQALVPKYIPVRNLLPGILSATSLPIIGPNYRPLNYRLKSDALGRVLLEGESLAAANVPPSDCLRLTVAMTAGASSVSESPRMRRLRADHQRMMELDSRSDLIDVKAVGLNPPERYIVTYHVPSVVGVDKKGDPKIANKHQVEIYLHSDYPHRWPGLKWLTPIWHPNISHANGSVCIDAAWWGAARSLDRLVIMMGEMLQWKNFHDDPTKPPFPWDKEAATWSREFRRRRPGYFPIDKRELMRPERVKLNTGRAPQSQPKAAEAKPAAKVKLTSSSKPAEKRSDEKQAKKPLIRLFGKK